MLHAIGNKTPGGLKTGFLMVLYDEELLIKLTSNPPISGENIINAFFMISFSFILLVYAVYFTLCQFYGIIRVYWGSFGFDIYY